MICRRCLRRGSRGFEARQTGGHRCTNRKACDERRERAATFDPVPLVTGRYVVAVEENDEEQRLRIRLSDDLSIEVYLSHLSPDDAYLDWVVTTGDG